MVVLLTQLVIMLTFYFNFGLFLTMLVLKVHTLYLMCESHIVALALVFRLSKMDVLANVSIHHQPPHHQRSHFKHPTE
jgi:hypothetical protein